MQEPFSPAAAAGLVQTPEGTYTSPDAGGSSTPTYATSRAERLASSRERILAKHGARAGYSEQDRTDVDVDDGTYVDNLNNKIANEYSLYELDFYKRKMAETYGLTKTDTGFVQRTPDGQTVPFQGDTNLFGSYYEFGTADGNIKPGTWGGVNPQDRYAAELLAKYTADGSRSAFIGPKGVNANDLRYHAILPVNQVDLLEGLVHGNKHMLENRAVRRGTGETDAEYYARRNEYGTGATEVYRPAAELVRPEGFDEEASWAAFREKYRLDNGGRLSREEEAARINAIIDADRATRPAERSYINRAGNAVQGLAAVATKELLVDTVDVVAEWVGLDVGTDEEKRKAVNNFFDYNPVFSEQAGQKAKEHVTNIYKAVQDGKDVELLDVYEAVKAGVTTPELLTESIGFIAATMFGLSKFTKTGAAIRDVESAFRAGDITGDAAKAAVKQIKKDASVVDAMKYLGAKNVGFTAVVAGNVNDTLDEFIANNNGQYTVSDVLRIGAVETLAVGLDRFAGDVALRDIPGLPKLLSSDGIKATKEVIEDISLPEYLRLMRPALTAASALTKWTGAGALEGATEYTQTLLGIFNQQYATEKYGTDVAAILGSEEAQIEALTGVALGFGMGVEMGVAGSGVGAVSQRMDTLFNRTPAAATPAQEAPVDGDDLDPVQIEADRAAYLEVLNRLHKARVEGQISAASLAENVADIETLRRVRYAAETGDPVKLKAADEALVAIETNIRDVITQHPDGNITLTSVFAKAAETTPEETLGSAPTAMSQKANEAVVGSLVDIVVRTSGGTVDAGTETKLYNLAKTNKVSSKIVESIIKSYQSVEDEATIGERGTQGRLRRLRLMLESGTTTPAAIQNEYNQAVNFYTTTVESIGALEQGLQDAEVVAATRNKSLLGEYQGKKQVEVATTYKTDVDGSSKGEPFKIYVRLKDGKWVVDSAEATKRVNAKRRTLKGLTGLINTFHQEAADKLRADRILNFGGYTIPVVGEGNATAAKEQAFVNEVTEVLADTFKTTAKINKVVLGTGKGKHWNLKGIRATANSAITNSLKNQGKDYEASDVVYLQASDAVVIKGKKTSTSELYNKKSPAYKEMVGAIEAGATIVVSYDIRMDKPEGARVANYLKARGYIALGPRSSTLGHIFVPDNEANAAIAAKNFEEATAKKVKQQEDDKLRNRLVTLGVELKAAQAGVGTRNVEEIEAELDSAMDDAVALFEADVVKESNKIFNKVSARAAEEETVSVETVEEGSLDEDAAEFDDALEAADVFSELIHPTHIEVKDSPKATAQAFVDAEVAKAVAAARKAVKADPEAEFDNEAIAYLVEKAEQEEAVRVAKTSSMLTNWKTAAQLRLTGNSLIKMLNDSLKEFGSFVVSKIKDMKDDAVLLRGQANNLLENSAGSTNTVKTYYLKVHEYDQYGNVITRDIGPKFTLDEGDVVGGKRKSKTGAEQTIVSINEVSHNPLDYLRVRSTTPMNTISVADMPEVVRNIAEQTKKTIEKVLPALSEHEVNIEKPKDGKDRSEMFFMLDSPARALIFDKDGKVSDQMAAAMGIALRDLMATDKFKLLVGPKDKTTVANLFKVREEEVTDAMLQFAAENGALAKTVAHTLGTSALQTLGISKKFNNEVSRGQYERLTTDLGNTILEIARADGTLAFTSPTSNKVAALFKDGETRTGEKSAAVTYFVHIPATRYKNERKLAKPAQAALDEFVEIDELMPNVTGNKKGPTFGAPPTQEYQNAALTTVRNDIVGGRIPKEAQEALTKFMNTPYKINMEGVESFLKLLEENELAVKAHLGYVELNESNPEYAGLLYNDKIIQESINRDVERSIEHLKAAYDAVNNGAPNELYFGYYYSSNHRYSIDSNTVNPQGDKLHRFFIQPSGHEVTYQVDKKAHTFTHEGKDVSLFMRAALAQAFGVGIDKEETSTIVDIGNAILSVKPSDLDTVRDSVVQSGSVSLNVDGREYKLEPDHISHFLQAVDFLKEYSVADTTITSSLSAELDALTSGFSNKVQQFGVLNNITEHARRVGIIRNAEDSNHFEMFEDGTVGINDLLAGKSNLDSDKNSAKSTNNLDSYKNLARNTIIGVTNNVYDLTKPAKTTFDALAGVLPGASQVGVPVDQISIDSKLRNLFKPGFMIFNYSAGISRITKNLGQEMVQIVLSAVAKADLSNKESAEYKAAEHLASIVVIGGKKPSVADLQKALRSDNLNKIVVSKKTIQSTGDTETTSVRLENYLIDNVISPTYGKSVEDAFNNEFKEFIKIQDTTNDLFKQTYAVFNQALLDKIKDFRGEDGRIITDDVLLGMIEELRPVFPVIVGPLSASIEDGIHVYDVDTKSPNEIMETVPSPATRYREGGDVKSRSMNPLIKSMVAAANAGAVLPFHAIDGAQMAKTINEFSRVIATAQGVPVLPVHDAVIPPLWALDLIGYLYNKNTVEINSTYSVINEIVGMAERIEAFISDESKFNVKRMEILRGLSLDKKKTRKEDMKELAGLEKKLKALRSNKNADLDTLATVTERVTSLRKKYTFAEDFRAVLGQAKVLKVSVEQARAEFFTEGTKVGAMVGLAGSVFEVGSSEMNTEYLDDIKRLYAAEDVGVVGKVEARKPVNVSDVMAPKGVIDVDSISFTDTNEDVRAALSTRIIVATAENFQSPYAASHKAADKKYGQPFEAGDVVMVYTDDKYSGMYGQELTEKDHKALEAGWVKATEEARAAIRAGATLVFIDAETLRGRDATVEGQAFIYSELLNDGVFIATRANEEGMFTFVSKREIAPEPDHVEIVSTVDVEGDIIAELNKESAEATLKKALSTVEEHSKRCK